VFELWTLIRFVHVLSATVWVGGQLTISALLLPVVRRGLAARDRATVMRGVGRRFGRFTVVVFLPVQLGSGVLLAWHHGVGFATLAEPGYGRTLLAKLIVVALVMAAAGVHGWAQGTRRAGAARAFAIVSLLGSFLIVLLAVSLVEG